MARYDSSTLTDIFWAANDGFKSGRDPMGIQNSSIATYGRLLPGMTNLTGHIRYYSLYCWLLDEYDKLDRQKAAPLHQYNFIRRAELIMAFVMRDEGVRAVVGSDFVAAKSDIIRQGDLYVISSGADYENPVKYWTVKSGAFGQYYLGALIHHGLVRVEEKRFYPRPKGKELAQALRESVDAPVLALYLRCILSGKISDEDIAGLATLGLNRLETGSPEWRILNDLLTKPDNDGSQLRRRTVNLMLSDIAAGVTASGFVEHCFNSSSTTDRPDKAEFGWYFYYMCEALHYGIETILCHILDCIGRMKNPPVRQLLQQATSEVVDGLPVERLYDSVDEWREDIRVEIPRQFRAVKEMVKAKEYAAAVAESLRLFMMLRNEFESRVVDILTFERTNRLTQQRGILSEGLRDYVGRHGSLTVDEYVGTLIHQVINEHTLVALGKMGKSDDDLRKFILEEERITLVEMRYPTETNPRTETLRSFLADLGYLTPEGELTAVAEQFMADYD